jgi:nitrogen fixation protein FixH
MKRIIFLLALVSLAIFISACGSGGTTPTATGKPVKSSTVNNLTVMLSTPDGVIKHGDTEVTLSFTDSAGKPVDVGAVSLNFHMPAMGSMSAMNNAMTLTTGGSPGVYRCKGKIDMAGEWQVQIAYEGAAGTGKTSFPVTVQ